MLQRIRTFCIDNAMLFCMGALGYGGIEVLVRGRTHWTMLLAGGLCLVGLKQLDRHLCRLPLLLRCAAGAAMITLVELAFGLICNQLLHWRVWDYSAHWANLWGQICPLFSFYWFLLCLPILWTFERTRSAWKS